METKHTPGPWHCTPLREIGDAPGIDIGAHNNANVAIVHHEPIDRNAQETKANARLIAAAPELYDALSGLLGLCQLLRCNELPANVRDALESNHRIDAARDALTKVEANARNQADKPA